MSDKMAVSRHDAIVGTEGERVVIRQVGSPDHHRLSLDLALGVSAAATRVLANRLHRGPYGPPGVSISGGGVFLGGWTPGLDAYVYHPLFEPIVTDVLREKGVVSATVDNHGGYNLATARRALQCIEDGAPVKVELK